MSTYEGLPVYHSWESVPEGLSTKTQLQKERLSLPDDASPVAYKRSYSPIRYFALYVREHAIAMPPKRTQQPRDYASGFERRYTSKRAAYLEACQSCFNLNRYAKHDTCTQKHQEAIYALKNALIRHLYEQGFCTEAVQVKTPARELVCYGCDGDGCERCDYEGIYRRIDGREYWAFKFIVDGQTFAWHQPAPLTFVPTPTAGNREQEVIAEEKPVALSPRKFAEAKALIAWCLDASDDC